MVDISAKMVGELRAKTDAPMMECKKALIEASGDMTRAEEILRVKLGNKATKVRSSTQSVTNPSIYHSQQPFAV
jgi:elongation factor Ts